MSSPLLNELRDPTKIRNHVITFFFQGHNGSRSQASKYVGEEGVSFTINNELKHALCHCSPRILHNIYVYPELEEIGYSSYNPFHQIIKLFTWADNKRKSIEAPAHISYVTMWNIGGEDDVRQHQTHLKALIDSTPLDKFIVVFGCSRGASTTLVSVAQLEKHYQDRISLVIVEAPFDTLPNTLNSWTYLRYLARPQLYLLEKIARYNPSQVMPIDIVESFPKTIPIGFITSNVDVTVPKQLTMNLITEFKNSGHPNIHHCELEWSEHSVLSIGHPDDQIKYYDFVEMLYAKYLDKKTDNQNQ